MGGEGGIRVLLLFDYLSAFIPSLRLRKIEVRKRREEKEGDIPMDLLLSFLPTIEYRSRYR